MPIPVWVLLGFAAWTLIILFTTVGVYRWSRILTADDDLRRKDKEGDKAVVYSMDDPVVDGPIVHTLSFAEAAVWGASIITKSSSQSSPTRWPDI